MTNTVNYAQFSPYLIKNCILNRENTILKILGFPRFTTTYIQTFVKNIFVCKLQWYFQVAIFENLSKNRKKTYFS